MFEFYFGRINMGFIQNIDFSILFWIQDNIRCAFLDVVMPFITRLCDDGEIWILFGIVLLFFKKYRRFGVFVLVAMLLGSIIGNEILKPIIARPRPCHLLSMLPEMLIDIPKITSFSFPSGHTTSSVIAATVLMRANKKFGFVAVPLAFLIAFSRMYLFVHFPTDIIGGTVLGVLIGFFSVTFGNKIWDFVARKIKERKEQKTGNDEN